MNSKKTTNYDEYLMDHEYDGIRELDNRMPPWWLNLFYISIIWSIAYVLYFHVLGFGDLSDAEYQKSVDPNWKDPNKNAVALAYHSPYHAPERDVTPLMIAQGGGKTAAEAPKEEQAAPEETFSFKLLSDASALSGGRGIYTKNCANCHGPQGQGGIGPNLTDNNWLNCDGSFEGIVGVIQNGVVAKGMIAWKNYLRPEEIQQVASYIHSIHGSEPPNPKQPQGQHYDRK